MQCNKCTKKFTTKQALIRHLEKVYPCDHVCRICGKAYRNTRQLNRHTSSNHTDVVIPAKVSATIRSQPRSLEELELEEAGERIRKRPLPEIPTEEWFLQLL